MAEREKTLDLGSTKLYFVLAMDSTTGDPIWAAEIDDFLIHVMSEQLYDFTKEHPIQILGSDLSNRNNFTFTEKFEVFKGMNLVGQANMFKDIIMYLLGDSMKIPSKNIIVSLFGKNSSHYISAIIDGINIRVDVSKLD